MKKSKKGTRVKRFISVLLTAIMMVCISVSGMNTTIYAQNGEAVTTENESTESIMICSGDVYTYEEDDYTVKYMIDGVWENNYTARIEITNKTDLPIENWMISFQCEDELSNIYNAQIVKHEEALYHIKNVEYNQDIPALGTVSFGFQVTYDDVAEIPHPYIVLSEDTAVENDSYQIAISVTDAWDGGYIGELVITNTGSETIEDWHLVCETEDEIISIWNAMLDSDGEEYEVIRAANYEQNIPAGESYVVGFQAEGNSQNVVVHNLYELKYTDGAGDSEPDKDKEDTSDTDGEETDNTDMNEEITEYDVIVDTSDLRAADLEDTYYVESDIYSLSGELVGFENVKKMEYVLADVNEYKLLEGTIFDMEAGIIPEATWNINDFGLAIGCNMITFKLTLKDDTIIEEGLVLIDLTGVNMDRVNIDLSDSDGDGLNNYFESVLKTNAELVDTDEDTLSDFDEFILFGTDPLLADSDGNGIADSQEDYDEDGLNAVEEKAYGTSVALADSDYDGVEDGVEVQQLSSNPMVKDTDGDTLLDGEEYAMGFNPTLADTDGDGESDCDEILLQTTSMEFGDETACVEKIEVTLECAGAIDNEVYIEDMTGRNALSNGVVGLVGAPINIHTDVAFGEAKMVFHYEPAELGNILEENLGVLWYDEENSCYVMMENVTVDTDLNTVTCITTHFSEYMLVDKEEWYSTWMQAEEYVPVYSPCDIAIMSDASASLFHYWTKGYGYVNFPNGYIEGENIIYGYYDANEARIFNATWARNQEQYDGAAESILYYHFILTSMDERKGDGKYGDGFEKIVEMFSNSYYEMLHSDNPKVVMFTYGGTILETEEQNQKVWDSVEKLKKMGVTVYAVSETDATSSVIENAAIATGGEHFNACSQEEAQKTWLKIHEKMSDLDKDTDEDGLPDVYEINGMRVPNGEVITTNPDEPDSDFDGRPDGEEMGELVDVIVEVDGEGTKKTFQVYKWVSDPKEPDTLKGAFIYVDGMDYMPECDDFNDLLYNNMVTNRVSWTMQYPVDRNGEYIYGITNLHNSLDYSSDGDGVNSYSDIKTLQQHYNKWIIFIAMIRTDTGDFLNPYEYLPAELLAHFLTGDGSVYEYDTNAILTVDINKMLLENLYYLKDECIKSLKKGDEVYIATSPSPSLPCSSIMSKEHWVGQTVSAVVSLKSFLAVNDGYAVYVAKCTYDGQRYDIYYNYYIYDYYDWDSKVIEDLYALNVYGICESYISIGKIEGHATFEDPSDPLTNYYY